MTPEIVAAILRGDCDESFEDIAEAMRYRREQLKSIQMKSIKVGSLVRFNNYTRPEYLQGVKGVVIQKKQKKVVVRLGETVGRFTKDVPINVPILSLDVVDEPA